MARAAVGAVVVGAVLVPSRRPAGTDDLQAAPASSATAVTAPAGGPTSPTTSLPIPAPDPMTAVAEAPNDAVVPMAEAAPTSAPAPVASSLDQVTSVLTDVAATAVTDDAVASSAAEPALDPTLVTLVLTDDGHLQLDRVPLDGTTDLAAVAADVVADGALVAASIDEMVQLDLPEAASDDIAAASSTNDAYRSQQWALDHVPFETAWSTGNGGGVIVAVIDTAVDLTHPDLAGQFVAGYHFLAAGTGPGVASVPPGNFHGTHVAGIIAAVANNGTGIAGGAPGAKIMPIEVLDGSGGGRYSDITSGIIYAADHGARVINLSLGGSSQSSTLDAAVAYAVAHGAVVMAAAGNSSCSVGSSGCSANYPAASPGATAIGSVTSTLACSSFTTRASYVSLGAPGSSIVSTAPFNLVGSGYVSASGTSMATPYASAAAATVFSAEPSATPGQVVSALESTAVDVADGGPDTCTGSGLVDPVAAVDSFSGGPPPTTTTMPTSLEAPRLAGALVGRGMVRLSFQSPPGSSLIIIRRDGTILATVAATRRSYTDRAVNPRQEYTYTVTAFADPIGESPVSVTRTVTTRG